MKVAGQIQLPPPDFATFFVDRCLGRKTFAQPLKDFGYSIEIHDALTWERGRLARSSAFDPARPHGWYLFDTVPVRHQDYGLRPAEVERAIRFDDLAAA